MNMGIYISIDMHTSIIYWTKVKTLHYNIFNFVRKVWTKRIY